MNGELSKRLLWNLDLRLESSGTYKPLNVVAEKALKLDKKADNAERTLSNWRPAPSLQVRPVGDLKMVGCTAAPPPSTKNICLASTMLEREDPNFRILC
jgi:hypothetical protein